MKGHTMEEEHMCDLFFSSRGEQYADNRSHLTSVGHLTREAIQKSILTQGF